MSVVTARNGAVLTVVIDRPERRNAVDPATAALLHEAFDAFEADDALSVAVLTGAGGAFCAGFDLKALAGGGVGYDPHGRGPMGPTRDLPLKAGDRRYRRPGRGRWAGGWPYGATCGWRLKRRCSASTAAASACR